MNDEEVVLVVLTLMIFAGIGVLYMAMSNRRALREMEHRERLAMIQRGLVPAPEADPEGFEAASAFPFDQRASVRAARWRSAGIMTIGVGLALMMLISFTAGEPGVGIGVGGAFAVLGATLMLNGSSVNRHDMYRARFPMTPVRPSPHQRTPGGPPSQEP